MKILYLLILVPCISFAQNKRGFPNVYVGAQITTKGLGNTDRTGIAMGFGYGLDKHFLVGAAFDGFIFSSSKPKYGAVRADFSYFINGHTKSGTTFFSFQPGIMIYNSGNYNGGLSLDALVGAKLKINKTASFFISAGYSRENFNYGQDVKVYYEGAKFKLALGI